MQITRGGQTITFTTNHPDGDLVQTSPYLNSADLPIPTKSMHMDGRRVVASTGFLAAQALREFDTESALKAKHSARCVEMGWWLLHELDGGESCETTDDVAPTTFPAGTPIMATVTGTNGGKRFFRTRSFVLARDSIEPGFIPARDGVPAEDRIFVQCSYGSMPELVVTGSIVKCDGD